MIHRTPSRTAAVALAASLLLAGTVGPVSADAESRLDAEASAHGLTGDELLDAVPYVNGDPDFGFEAVKGRELGKLRADKAAKQRAAAGAHDDDGPGIGPEVRPAHAGLMTKEERKALLEEWAAAKAARKAERKAAKNEDGADEDDDGDALDDDDDGDDRDTADKPRRRGKPDKAGKKAKDRTGDDGDDESGDADDDDDGDDDD